MADEVKSLSPQEAKTVIDGERMLNAIQKQKEKEQGGPAILGSDGKPMEKPAVKELTPEEQARKDKEEAELKAYRMAKAKVEANATQLKEIFKEHPDAQTCANLIQHFWMGLFWGLNQIQTYVGMTNELVQHLSDASRINAMQAQVPIPQLAAAIKNKSLPFMLQLSREYEAEQNRRRAKLTKAITRMPNGITVPVPQIKELFHKFKFKEEEKQIFFLEHLLVLHGSVDAVGKAVRVCSKLHKDKDEGLPYFLSCNPIVTHEDQQASGVVMPLSWWQNKAVNDEMLADTLAPIVKTSAMLVVVENLGTLLTRDEKTSAAECRLQALARLYSWSYTHQMAVIVGDEVANDEQPNYGKVPHMSVHFNDKKNLVFGDSVYLEG